MADAELTNYRSGISHDFSGTRGVDWAEEYWYHDKLINDRKVVYIRSSTAITLAHNASNIGGNMQSTTTPLQRPGVLGKDGIADSGDEGIIRYKVDGDLSYIYGWSNKTNLFPAYAGALSFATLQYPMGGAVLGKVGAVAGSGFSDKENYYHGGIQDAYGDEWHVLAYADDDKAWLLKIDSAYDNDFFAGDGKSVLFVVDPKTPCLTLRALTGSAQFYTSPAKTYYTPVIWDQTSYVTGGVEVSFVDIFGGAVSYRVDGGSWVTAGTLNTDSLADGAHTLEYRTARTGIIKTRAIVKNPAFPSAGETHGGAWYGYDTALRDKVISRITTGSSAIRTQYDYIRTKNTGPGNGQSILDGKYRLGTRNMYGWVIQNAFIGWVRGNSSKMSTGSAQTYVEYAKRAMLDSFRNIDQLGHEIEHAGGAIPSRELHYRGYYDTEPVIDIAIAYDMLISVYRSDQHANGITPIEDYFLRDMMARFVHEALMWAGNWTLITRGGMWDTARRIGAAICGMVMPKYDTAYFGTSGFDGVTTTGRYWTPFPNQNFTWKRILLDNDTPRPGYPNQVHPFGIDEYLVTTDGVWVDRLSYFGWALMGNILAKGANLLLLNYGKRWPGLEATVANAFQGNLTSVRFPSEGKRLTTSICFVNNRFPQIKTIGLPVLKSLTTDQGEEKALSRAGIWGVMWYDDDTTGITFPPAITSQPTASTVSTGGSAAFSVAVSGTGPFSYQWQKDGSDIPGATAAAYVVARATPADAGSYLVRVQGPGGSVVSRTVDLVVTVVVPPASLSQQWPKARRKVSGWVPFEDPSADFLADEDGRPIVDEQLNSFQG